MWRQGDRHLDRLAGFPGAGGQSILEFVGSVGGWRCKSCSGLLVRELGSARFKYVMFISKRCDEFEHSFSYAFYFPAFADPTEALLLFTTRQLPVLAGVLTIASVLPLPHYALLGNAGEPILAPLAPLCLVMATGVAWMFWGAVFWLVRGLSIARARLFGVSYVLHAIMIIIECDS